jgi:hypothetical protein
MPKHASKLQRLCMIDSSFVFCVDIVASAVLSGNRNFEGRVHPLTRANYLASPPLVVAYALAGTVSPGHFPPLMLT